MNHEQEKHQRMAELLGNFSKTTIESVLSRFDAPTQEFVRRSLPHATAGRAETLDEFARFLYYFEQPNSEASQSGRGPSIGDEPPEACRWTIEDVMKLADDELDTLLTSAPAEMTISVLCCSQKSFVQRVLKRLTDDQATHVARQINETETIQFDEMQLIQTRYCQFAFNLLNKESQCHET